MGDPKLSSGARAYQVVVCYQKRMQIEEALRDLHDACVGVGVSLRHTTQAERLAILLLIAALVQPALWLGGQATVKPGCHWRYQATPTRCCVMVSVIAVGLHVARRARERFTRHDRLAPQQSLLITLKFGSREKF